MSDAAAGAGSAGETAGSPVGVLVMAYGTASGPGDIERYYTDIRGGRPPSAEHLAELTERYAAIGNRFPLTEITEAQAAGLEAALGEGFATSVGMKHSPPFIPDVVARMAADGIERAVGIVMAPHFSRMSVGSYRDRVERGAGDALDVSVIESWHDHPAYLEVLADRVSRALGRGTSGDAGAREGGPVGATLAPEEAEGALVVFTAHSLPARIVAEGDPYPGQLAETARLVGERLGLANVETGWQSAGRTAEEWLGPPLEETIARAAKDGYPAIVVVPCGFVSDHLEILYDLDIEAQEVARDAGIRLVRTESMNAAPDFVAALARIVRDHLR